MKWLGRAIVLLFVAGFAAALFTPYCHALFSCGCQGAWAAGSRFCNVHTPGVAHCPWCSTGWWGANLPKALVWMAQSVIVLAPSRLSLKSRLALGLLAFVILGAVVGLIFGLSTHYPTFLSHTF